MARSYRERRVYQEDPAEVRRLIDRAVREAGLKPRLDGPPHEVRASNPISLITWGEQIAVTSATNPGGGTQVIAESRLAFGLVDWGRNRRNVETILGILDGLLSTGPDPDPTRPPRT